MRSIEQRSNKNKIIHKEAENRKEHTSKIRTRIYSVTLAVFAVFLLSITAGIVIHNESATISNVNPAASGSYASSGLWQWNYYDRVGKTVWTTSFEANWTFSPTNGSLIHSYSPYWAATLPWWNLFGSTNLRNPGWANTGQNTYVAYGDGTYHWGVWYATFSQKFYSQWEVPAGSYGTGQFSAGYGWVSY